MAMIAGREYCMRSFPMGFVPNSNVALLFILFLFWEDRTRSGCTGSSLLYHEDVVAVFFSVFLFGFRLRRILQVALLVKHTVCRAEHDEFGAAVKLVAYFLLLLVELLDVIHLPSAKCISR